MAAGIWFDGTEQWYGANGVLTYELTQREIAELDDAPCTDGPSIWGGNAGITMYILKKES